MGIRLNRFDPKRVGAAFAQQRKGYIAKDFFSRQIVESAQDAASWRNPWTRFLAKLLAGGAVGAFCAHKSLSKFSDDDSLDITARISNWPQDKMLKFWQEAWSKTSNQSNIWFYHVAGSAPKIVAESYLSVPFSGELAWSDTNVFLTYPELVPKHDGIAGEPEKYRGQNNRGDCLTRYTIADAVAKVAPAVVNITVTSGARGLLLGQSSGSGFIIGSDGTILTNAHVLADIGSGSFRGKITVSMQDGRSFEGELVNYDTAADIAIVKIHSKSSLPTVTLGSSQKLRSGEWVIALGSPLHLQNTVTVGVVSCVERKSSEIGLQGVRADYIQSDVAINQGNSGGPLLNIDGEVVGINTMKAFAADGVSFAIPIDSATKVVEQLKKHGRVVRPWLGIKMLELSPPVLSQLKERDSAFPDVSEGVLVAQVIPGSPAEKAGIRPGDVIVEFGGKPVNSVHQIVEALGDMVGLAFKVLVKRAHGQQATLTVVSEEASPSLY